MTGTASSAIEDARAEMLVGAWFATAFRRDRVWLDVEAAAIRLDMLTADAHRTARPSLEVGRLTGKE